MTLIYNFDNNGYYINSQIALVDEFGKEILPEGATYVEPLKEKEGFRIKFNGEGWVYEEIPHKKEPTLDELKILKREEINRIRNAAEQGGFEYMGKIFDSDPISCQRISCAAQAMSIATMSEEVPTITWTCQDNTTIDLNPQELMGLVVALAQWSNACHQKATALKEKIESCTSKEELDKVVWE